MELCHTCRTPFPQKAGGGKITNKTAIAICDHTQRHKNKNSDLHKEFGKLCPEINKLKVSNVADKMSKLEKLKTQLSKNKQKEAMDDMLNDKFCMIDLPKLSMFQEQGAESSQDKIKQHGHKEKTAVKRSLTTETSNFTNSICANLAQELQE